jgi:hypothetical protein
MEREEVGSGKRKRLEKKYTMKQLLDPEFTLPREGEAGQDDPVQALKQMAGMGGVKVFKVDN